MTDAVAQFRFGNFADWRTDPALCANGVPFDAKLGRTLIVKRAGGMNRKLMAAMSNVSPDDERTLMRAYSDHVVVGWEGVTDPEGNPVPFSPEACLALFDYAPELFLAMLVFVGDRTNYGAEKLQEGKDNLKT